jgi:hypothetical protein
MNDRTASDLLHLNVSMPGYLHGTPPHLSRHTLRIDAETVGAMLCGECGHEGLAGHHWHASDSESYLLLAVCPECGWSEEV